MSDAVVTTIFTLTLTYFIPVSFGVCSPRGDQQVSTFGFPAHRLSDIQTRLHHPPYLRQSSLLLLSQRRQLSNCCPFKMPDSIQHLILLSTNSIHNHHHSKNRPSSTSLTQRLSFRPRPPRLGCLLDFDVVSYMYSAISLTLADLVTSFLAFGQRCFKFPSAPFRPGPGVPGL